LALLATKTEAAKPALQTLVKSRFIPARDGENMRDIGHFMATMTVMCAGLVTSAIAADRFDPIRAAIPAMLTERKVPSVAIAVAKDGQIIWEQGFGLANKEKQIPATADTAYSLASISKPLTGAALMTLVRDGKVDLDRPINDYLGDAKITARIGDVRAATVRRVANHSSGLPTHYQWFYANEPWRRPLPNETIRRYGVLMSLPGEKFEYSNLGYGILSTAIAHVSGESFHDYMRDAVFAPLGMTHSSVDLDPALSVYEAVRYDTEGQPIPSYQTDHEGASAIYTSVHDLARFGIFSLKKRLPDQKRILTDAQIDAMLKPTMMEPSGAGYGVGWERTERSGYTVYAHTGGMTGVATEFRIVPSQNLVVVVFCNAEDYDFPATIADRIMTAMIPHWQAPSNQPAAVNVPFAPQLAGIWKGTVSTHQADIPLILTVMPSGDVHAKLGEQWEALVNRPHLTSTGFFRGIFTGSLNIPDGVRRPYVLGLNLKLRSGTVMNGEITARADIRGVMPTNGLYPSVNGQPAPARVQTDAFLLAQWAELQKQ
jgi:CubicO group peptidase (beta-lactamase class C family)